MKDFFKKSWVKNIILGGLTLIIGGFCSAIGNWDKTQSEFLFKAIIIIICSIIYLGAIIYYGVIENNDNKVNLRYRLQNKAYNESVVSLASLLRKSSTDFNKMYERFKDNCIIDFNIWSFQNTCNWVCSNTYQVLDKLTNGEISFRVNYAHVYEYPKNDGSKKRVLRTIAFANSSQTQPNIFMEDRLIYDTHGYYDVRIVKENNPDIVILSTATEVENKFNYRGDREKYRGKYEQFIGIPVVDNKNNIIGILQILTEQGCKLGNTRKELEEISKSYLIPFVFFILFVYNIEKGISENKNNLMEEGKICQQM